VDNSDAPLYRVLLAYGTSSQRVGEWFSGEFAITPADTAAYQLAGLSYPTKFDLRERVLLPYTSGRPSVSCRSRRGLGHAPG